MPALVEHVSDVLDVLRPLETVADDDQVLVHQLVRLQFADQVKIVGGRCLKMHVALESLLDDKLELGTLGAVAVVMVTFVADLRHGVAEHSLGPLDL